MKTITGKVLSSTPISISKAASILSKFVSADTGASQAVCAYLRRASVSFNELALLHKELKSNRKHKAAKSEFISEEERPTRSVLSNQPLSQPEFREPSHGVSDGVESGMKKHKKKKKKENGVQIVEDEFRIKNEVNQRQVIEQSEKKKHKKKIGDIRNLREDKVKMGTEEAENLGMENERKKHKKKKEKKVVEISNLKENGGGIVIEEEKKAKKKRKSGEIEEGTEVHSEESPVKKKKKRKTEHHS